MTIGDTLRMQRLRRWCDAACMSAVAACLAPMLATACATDRAAAAPPAKDPAEPVVARASAQLASTAPVAPRPERRGVGAAKVWAPPKAPDQGVGCIDADGDRLSITEVRADATSLYLDVVHRAPAPVTGYRAEPATIELLLNMCAAPAPRVDGRIWQGWPSPSTLTVALADLPDGELDVMVRAFEQQRTIPLLKTGKALSYLPIEKRAGYRFQPGDPKTGREPSASLDEWHCPGEEVQP